MVSGQHIGIAYALGHDLHATHLGQVGSSQWVYVRGQSK